MSSGLSASNPTIVSAFRSLLLHEALFAVLILVDPGSGLESPTGCPATAGLFGRAAERDVLDGPGARRQASFEDRVSGCCGFSTACFRSSPRCRSG